MKTDEKIKMRVPFPFQRVDVIQKCSGTLDALNVAGRSRPMFNGDVIKHILEEGSVHVIGDRISAPSLRHVEATLHINLLPVRVYSLYISLDCSHSLLMGMSGKDPTMNNRRVETGGVGVSHKTNVKTPPAFPDTSIVFSVTE